MARNSGNSKWMQQEEQKASKVKLRRESYFFKLLGVSGIVLSLFYVLPSDKSTMTDTAWNLLRVNYAEIKANGLMSPINSFHYEIYFFVFVPIAMFIKMFFTGTSLREMDKKEYVHKKRYKAAPSIFFKTKKTIISFFEILSRPLSIAIDSLLPIRPEDKFLRKKIGFHYGWLSSINENFFKQTFVKIDGYKRAKELNIFQDYNRILRGKNNDENREIYLLNLFKSKNELEDLFKITEGYLAAKGKEEKLFDTFLDRKQTKKHITHNNYYSFRAFNGKDEVFYSQDVVENLIDLEYATFKDFINKYIVPNLKEKIDNPKSKNILRTTFYYDFLKYYTMFISQKNEIIEEILYPDKFVSNGNDKNKLVGDTVKEMKKTKEGNKKLVDRTAEVICYYFIIIIFRKIISQYLNLPAGTIVSKIKDYSLRMIIEIYDENSLIEISKNKNDGTSKSFKSDIFANLFLTSYINFAKKAGTISLDDRLKIIFNFGVDAINKQLLDNPIFTANKTESNEKEIKIDEMVQKYKKDQSIDLSKYKFPDEYKVK